MPNPASEPQRSHRDGPRPADLRPSYAQSDRSAAHGEGVVLARAAAGAAAAAFPAFSELGPTRHRELLWRAADLLEARGELFAAVMADEMGATPEWARFNIELGAAMLREAGALTTQVTGEVIASDRPGSTAMAIRQPVGVVLGIAPWNAPIILAVRAIAMPLACGNTVVLKGSEICPKTHQLLVDVLVDAGMGNGVVSFVVNAPTEAADVMETLIAHPSVRRVNFTGSTRVGRIIGVIAARYLKPALLELGGKATVIVLDDADIEEAVAATAFGAFMNQGQICMSTERVVVDDAVADRFAEKLCRKADRLIAGPAGNAPLGRLIGADAVERISAIIDDAVSKGARIIAGGRIDGLYMDATVIDDVTPGMRIYAEEVFGPVAALIRVRGVEEAVRVANDTEYGLSSAVFGRDIGRAMRVARRIEAGICHINGPTVHDEPQMPFGGMKASGYGRFGGKAAIDEFTEMRWITVSTRPGDYPI